jgi:hypothetical protein
MKLLKLLSLLAIVGLVLTSCDTTPPAAPKIIFKFKFDSTQVRLDGLGNPAIMPANHRGQSPQFNLMSCHYIELAPDMYTALGTGAKLYKADTAATGAIDFNASTKVGENETFFSMPIADIPEGTYQWLRVSLAYQNYNISYKVGPPVLPSDYYGVGTIASFIGYRTYITSYTINTQSVSVNADKLQGYWGFETAGTTYTGQAPPGATTVPNPLFATSPIPSGSCVVTAAFSTPLTISHSATSDITIEVSLSTNKSFEWIEHGGNNLYEPLNGDTVIDMGVRGMIPTVIQ